MAGCRHQKDSFGKEAIETLMKHMDPPSCVIILAGYEKPMEAFLKVNPGLARRLPYRYSFTPYTCQQLSDILEVMCASKGEVLDVGVQENVVPMLQSLSGKQRAEQNAGLCSNWVSFAQIERDDRIDIAEARRNPAIASLLKLEDFVKALDKVRQSDLEGSSSGDAANGKGGDEWHGTESN